MPEFAPLLDRFGRTHTNLRISVTDRCNIRCFYCMPDEALRFLPRHEILTFEEIVRFAAVAIRCGVDRIRLTGGEPLVRSDLPELVARLSDIPGLDDLALTTNGILLGEQAVALRAAGLHRLNVSLDALDPQVFETIARRRGLNRVLDGISAAIEAGFTDIRLNAVSIRGLTETEIVPLARFARVRNLELRFIEFMPLDGDGQWSHDAVLTGDEVRAVLEREFGPLRPAPRLDPAKPAVDFEFASGGPNVGFINPVSHAFCGECDRLRLTAEGKIRNCLFSLVEWDARVMLRGDATDAEVADLLRDCVAHKKAGHGIDDPNFVQPERAMYQIGG
ncbi:MAG: GTP 3',8-cyclase MoaA [Pirellulales bacterium]